MLRLSWEYDSKFQCSCGAPITPMVAQVHAALIPSRRRRRFVCPGRNQHGPRPTGTAHRRICRPGRRSSAAQACPWASARVAHLCVTYGRSLASSIAPGITRARVYGVRPKRAKPAVPPNGGASTSLRILFHPDAPHDRASRWCDAFLVSRRKFDDSRMSAGRRDASTESASRGAPVGAGGKLAVVGGVGHVDERAKAPESPRVAKSACERLIWSMPVSCG